MVVTVMTWAEDEDRSTAMTGVAAKNDPFSSWEISGDTIKYKSQFPYLLGAYASAEVTASGGGFEEAKLTAPSITQKPLYLNAGFGTAGIAANTWDIDPTHVVYDFSPGWQLFRAGEYITANIEELDEAGVAHFGAVVLIVSDRPGQLQQRAAPINWLAHNTCGAVAAAVTWGTSALTESDTLPAGRYEMWGADIVSATAISAGFYFPNNQVQGSYLRPVIPRRDSSEGIHPWNRNWGQGIPFTIPGDKPVLYMFCEATDTPEQCVLFLRKVS